MFRLRSSLAWFYEETFRWGLHAFVKKVVPDMKGVQHIVEVGANVYEMILDAIKRSEADLVVMGAHKPELMDRLQGPNSARVARYAKCSVLIVRD